MMKNTLVVARYNEDLSWLNRLDLTDLEIVVLNKGGKINIPHTIIDLENIGREAHSFVYFIDRYYDILPEFSIFVQGNPFDHFPHLIDFINNKSYKQSNLFALTEKTIYIGPGDGTDRFIYNIFDMQFNGINFPCGAQYSVMSELIKYRGKKFWNNILTKMPWREDGFLPYFFERTWPIFYDVRIPTTQNYLDNPYFQFNT